MKEETKLGIALMLFVFGLLMLISSASAQDPFDIRFFAKQNENLTIKDTCTINGLPCSGSSSCNFTIIKPDRTYLIQQSPGFKQGDYWNYNLNSSQNSIIGLYEATVYCKDGAYGGKDSFYYQVTTNGNGPPTDVMLTVFTIIFIVLVFGLVFVFLYTIGGLVSLSVHVLDVALSVGAFLVLLTYDILEKYYIGNPMIENVLPSIIDIARYTNLYLPVLGFLLTMILGPLLFKKYPNFFKGMPGYKAPYDGEGAMS